MSNSTKTQPVCPCASGDVNYAHEGDAYCPWCEWSYGPWATGADGFAEPLVPIDYESLVRGEYAGYEDAAMESGLFGDC